MTDASTLHSELLARLPYTPTEQQAAVAQVLCRFATADTSDGSYRAFILNGYAGTGKTTLTGALVGALEACGTKVVLLAPTGRAAKVFSAGAGGRRAFTIHRRIYRHQPGAPGQAYSRVPAPNKERDAVFIVDEASMIGTADTEGVSLLHDLVQYVYSGDGCRMILLGDTAQLPPVGAERSPAMNSAVLRSLGIKVSAATLTSTVRQRAGSGILYNATALRHAMVLCAAAEKEARTAGPDAGPDLSAYIPKLDAVHFADVRVASHEDLPDLLEKAYGESLADAVVITRSNRRAAEFNRAIRNAILWREEELCCDDLLIVSKNHYFPRKGPSGIDFIANGDIITVQKVYGTETRYGMRFADVRIAMADGAGMDIKVMTDTLSDEKAGLSTEQWTALYTGILNDNDRFGDTPPSERLAQLPRDPYWTALQVKYAYAITCHKAQGGQWSHVFVDLAYIPPEAMGVALYRWLYTAVTRARTTLCLIAPPEAMLAQAHTTD